MADGKELEHTKKTVRHYNKNVLLEAINFILNDSNIQQVSWGTKKVILEGMEKDFSWLIKCKNTSVMLTDYISNYPECNQRIGESSFKKLVKCLTHDNQKAKAA